MTKIIDTGLHYDRIFTSIDTSLRSLIRWTLTPQPIKGRCGWVQQISQPWLGKFKEQLGVSCSAFISRLARARKSTFLMQQKHWRQHLWVACLLLEHPWVSYTFRVLLMPASPSASYNIDLHCPKNTAEIDRHGHSLAVRKRQKEVPNITSSPYLHPEMQCFRTVSLPSPIL